VATVSVSIAAGGDDGYWRSGNFSAIADVLRIGLGPTNYSTWMRFTGLSALHGATISSATITAIANDTDSGAAEYTIRARAADNPAAPTTEAEATGGARHATSVSWPAVPAFTVGTAYTTPDLTALIQALVTDGYLASGVVLIYIEPVGSAGTREFASYENSTYAEAQLTVEYSYITSKSGSDADTVSVTDAASAAVTLSRSDSDTISVTETAQVDVVVSVSASDSATITGTDAVVGINVGVSDSDTVGVTESVSISAGVSGSDSDSAAGSDASSGTVAVTSADSDTAGVGSETIHIALSADDSDTVSITEDDAERRIIPITYDPRLAIDVYDSSGNRLGSGPIVGIITAEYTGRLDEIGTWTVSVDATELNAAELTRGREVWIRREGEGLLFRGIIDVPDATVGDADDRILTVSGQSVAEQLVWANTLLGRTFSGDSMAAATNDLLTGTGWTAGTVDTGTLVSARFDGVTIWAALREIAKIQDWHLREDNLNRTVSLTEAGGASGLVIRQVEHPDVDLGVIPLAKLRVTGDDQELVNCIVPLGAGEGVNQLTLQHASGGGTYTIQSATGPDGETYWYLEDAASVATYGRRTRILKLDQVAPLSNSDAEINAAADALYALASAALRVSANPVDHYEADVALLRHIDGGSPTFLLGQTVRLQYTGIVSDADGTRRAWRSVDADVYIMGYRRSFQTDGSDRWTLELATADVHAGSAVDAITDAVEDLWTIRTAMHPYTYREVHGPYRESVDSSHDATVTIDYDDAVTYLHRAELRLVKRKVRSNVSTAAAGGTTTSNATTTAANSGGGTTSAGGSSHTHSISAAVTSDDIGEHYHQIGQAQPTASWADPGYMQQMIFATSAGGGLSYGIYGGRNGTEGSTRTLWTSGFTFHQHNILATATSSESSHTHSVPAHSHTINAHSHSIAQHTHSLTYGIFEGPTASTPGFTIQINGTDVTAALGGPWNGDTVLDITPWLVDANGHVLRQANNLVVTSGQLCDIEMTVKSFVTALSVVPV